MKEIPILFSTPMVLALLERRKTMTRRVIKHQIIHRGPLVYEWPGNRPKAKRGTGACTCIGPNALERLKESMVYDSPYGKAGDFLWVRESFYTTDKVYWPDLSHKVIGDKVYYHSCGFPDRNRTCAMKKKPSLFMPRDVCRLYLEITDVKVERLQDITDEDALAEGVICKDIYERPVDAFKRLWIEINGQASWDANPWIWAISFEY